MAFGFLYRKKTTESKYDYDPEKEIPVIRASICNGEQVAGFKNIQTAEFHDVMLITSPSDLEAFKQKYGVENIRKEY